jgi:hypothetical protein
MPLILFIPFLGLEFSMVSVVPFSAFGTRRHSVIRLSLATITAQSFFLCLAVFVFVVGVSFGVLGSTRAAACLSVLSWFLAVDTSSFCF